MNKNEEIQEKIDKDLEIAEEFCINILYIGMMLLEDEDEYPIVIGFHKEVL